MNVSRYQAAEEGVSWVVVDLATELVIARYEGRGAERLARGQVAQLETLFGSSFTPTPKGS